MKNQLSLSLSLLATNFEEQTHDLPLAMIRHRAKQLRTLAQYAERLETELDAFRRMEADRAKRDILEGEALTVMTAEFVDDDNILRPSFGRANRDRRKP